MGYYIFLKKNPVCNSEIYSMFYYSPSVTESGVVSYFILWWMGLSRATTGLPTKDFWAHYMTLIQTKNHNKTNHFTEFYQASIKIIGSPCPSVCQFVAGITHQEIKPEISKMAINFRMITGVPGLKWTDYLGQSYLQTMSPSYKHWKLNLCND